MKLGIMQPYFFPYIGYWQLLNYVDTYVVYDDVNYINKGWINRNYILFNGNRLLLTLSLKQASQNKLINEITIGSNQSKILKTIFHAYSKAPYFDSVYPLIEEIISSNEQNLASFLLNSIQKIVDFLGIRTDILLSSEIDKNNVLKGQDKILEICTILGANTYVNAINGRNIYESDIFEKRNIDLYFLKSHEIEYKQFSDQFDRNLSIIDVLMFNPTREISKYLEKFDVSK